MTHPAIPLLLAAAGRNSAGSGASPVVEGSTTSNSTTNGETSHPVTLPGSIAVGELILVIFAVDGAPSVSIDTGASGSNWTLVVNTNDGSNCGLAVAWKIAEGSDALTITTGSGTGSTHISYRISGPGGTVGASTISSGASAAADPNNLSVGVSRNYLWFACASVDSDAGTGTEPSGYSTVIVSQKGGAGYAEAMGAYLAKTDTQENPGAFTNTNDQWVACTVVIHPT